MQWNVKKCNWTDHREQQSSSSSRNVPHVNRQASNGSRRWSSVPLATANPPATQPQESEQRQPHIKLSNLCVHSPQCMPAVCIRHSIRSCLNIYQTFSVFSNLKSLQFSNLKTFFCQVEYIHTLTFSTHCAAQFIFIIAAVAALADFWGCCNCRRCRRPHVNWQVAQIKPNNGGMHCIY